MWVDERSLFRIDDFEALTLNLCYGYARCPKAVSMVAPAYYAHLVATRARNLYLAERNMRRQQMNRGAAKQPIKLPEIHSDIKAKMYWCWHVGFRVWPLSLWIHDPRRTMHLYLQQSPPLRHAWIYIPNTLFSANVASMFCCMPIIHTICRTFRNSRKCPSGH